jgi:predicted enzyme related to lactoylglutathione lyase
MITKIAFVAHPTTDMGPMKSFYGDVLGLKLNLDFGDMWAEYDAPDGKTIALDPYTAKNMEGASVYLALESDDIEADVARIKESGATVVKDVWTNEHEGKEICSMALVLDPDGNMLMIHQMAAWRAEGGD